MTKGLIEMTNDGVKEGNLMKRYGKPEEVAAAAIYYSSKASNYATGKKN